MSKKIIKIMGSLLVAAIVAFLVIPVFGPYRWGKRLVGGQCVRNNRHIAVALNEYARDHLGEFPLDLRELYPKYIPNPLTFYCLGDKDNVSPLTITSSLKNGKNSARISYDYFPGCKPWDDPNTVIVRDNSYSHHKWYVHRYYELRLDWEPHGITGRE